MIGDVRAHAAARAGDPAVVHGDETISWSALLERVERFADGLGALGVEPGAAVALVAPNSAEFVVAFLAIVGLGAVVVPLSPQLKPDEIEFSFRTSGVRAAVADEFARPAVRDAAARLGREMPIVTSGATSGDPLSMAAAIARHPRAALAERAPEETLLHQYSSGSTGRPKQVARTHGGCRAEGEAYRTTIALTAADRIFCAVPLGHSYATGACLFAFARSGAALVVLDDPHPFVLRRARALELIERERATIFPGVPYTYRLLAEAPGEADLSSLRLCFSAGTALPRPVFEAFRARFGLPVRQLYGSTETGVMTMNLDPDPDPTSATVGTPVHGVTITVLDDDGEPVAPGADGEVVVSGPSVVDGYGGAERAAAAAFRDGRFFTGDLGRLDADGRLTLTGRRLLTIEVAGNKVDPVEVEDVLTAHPAVAEAVVVGVRGDVEGEELVKAVLVRRGPCDERELIPFCAERLASFKVPRIVAFVDEIPRSPVGKVLRKDLV